MQYLPVGAAGLTTAVALLPLATGGGSDAGIHANLDDHCFHIFQQTEFISRTGDRAQDNVQLLSLPLADVVGDHLYVPVQASIAYASSSATEVAASCSPASACRPRPSRASPAGLVQAQAGINVHGLIVKTAAGLDFALGDHFALSPRSPRRRP